MKLVIDLVGFAGSTGFDHQQVQPVRFMGSDWSNLVQQSTGSALQRTEPLMRLSNQCYHQGGSLTIFKTMFSRLGFESCPEQTICW